MIFDEFDILSYINLVSDNTLFWIVFNIGLDLIVDSISYKLANSF